MANPRVTFNDGVAGTVQSDWPTPANRFAGWTPMTRPKGDSAFRQSDETLYMFVTSTRYGATFKINGLAMGAAAGSALDVANRLVAHLLKGGSCAVFTEDALGSSYATCGLMPETTPTLEQTDARTIEYTLSLALINLGAATPMTCHYA